MEDPLGPIAPPLPPFAPSPLEFDPGTGSAARALCIALNRPFAAVTAECFTPPPLPPLPLLPPPTPMPPIPILIPI